MIDPTTAVVVPPGTESWPERYGPIGVVALLALLALGFSLRQFLVDRKAERELATKQQEQLDAQVAALNGKLVEVVRESQRETLQRLADQQQVNDARYGALLERTMSENTRNAEALRAQNTAITDTLNVVMKKLSRGAD